MHNEILQIRCFDQKGSRECSCLPKFPKSGCCRTEPMNGRLPDHVTGAVLPSVLRYGGGEAAAHLA